MRKIRCYECGKSYDYDVDDFCPRCGAYTQPARNVCIDAQGTVVRVDGINETYHRESFVHTEYHAENRRRKGTALEKKRDTKKNPVPCRKAPSVRTVQITQPLQNQGKAAKEEKPIPFLWSILAAVILMILSEIL